MPILVHACPSLRGVGRYGDVQQRMTGASGTVGSLGVTAACRIYTLRHSQLPSR